MAVISLLVSKKSAKSAYVASLSLVVLGWIVTAIMGAVAARMCAPE